MLDAVLPHDYDALLSPDAEQWTHYTEEARQLARLHISQEQSAEARRFNLRHHQVDYYPGDQVWLRTPVRRQRLSEKLISRYFGQYTYKVLRRVSDVN